MIMRVCVLRCVLGTAGRRATSYVTGSRLWSRRSKPPRCRLYAVKSASWSHWSASTALHADLVVELSELVLVLVPAVVLMVVMMVTAAQ